MWAANWGALHVVEILLVSGADPNLVAEDGWTALGAAEMTGDDEILRLLEAAGATAR